MSAVVNFFDKLFISGNIILTIQNFIWFGILVIGFICLFKTCFDLRRNGNDAFVSVIFAIFMLAFAFFYNGHKNLISEKAFDIINLLPLIIVAVIGVITLISQAFFGIKSQKTLSGIRNYRGEYETEEQFEYEYKQELKRRNRRYFFLNMLRDIFMVLSCLTIPLLSKFFYGETFKLVSLIKFSSEQASQLTAYSLLIVIGVIVSAILGWIVKKFDELY